MQSNLSFTFSDFLASPPGQYVLRWEQTHLDRAVADIFGYHAVQLGMPEIDTLAENRMPLRLLVSEGVSDRVVENASQPGDGSPQGAGSPHADRSPQGDRLPEGDGSPQGAGSPHADRSLHADRLPQGDRSPQGDASGPRSVRRVAVITRFEELPFATQSIDLVVMPHILEFAQEPHQVLREVDRVLLPEGQVIITGFNPASLWGLRQALSRTGAGRPYLPRDGQFISLPRIKDWLKLLSFETNRGRFGCYAPWAGSERWLARWSFMEKAGDRWWPVFGSVYLLSAVKRVRGMRVIGPVRRRKEERRVALAPATTPRTPVAFTVRVEGGDDAANDTARDAAHG
jgi:SAM-dependent methyltransferase